MARCWYHRRGCNPLSLRHYMRLHLALHCCEGLELGYVFVRRPSVLVQSIVNEMNEYLKSLKAEQTVLQDKLNKISQDVMSVESILETYPKWRMANPHTDTTPFDEPITALDIANCESIRSALVEIAMRNNGMVKSRFAAALVIEAGLTQSTSKDGVAAGVYNRMKSSPDFAYEEPGTFRYLPFFCKEQQALVTDHPLFAGSAAIEVPTVRDDDHRIDSSGNGMNESTFTHSP